MAGNTVTVRANIDLRGSLRLKDLAQLPPTAEVGTVLVYNGVLYGYQDFEGIQMWYPLTQASRAYTHNQGVPALEWTVTHDLDSTQVWFAVQDEQGHPVYPQKETIDANSFMLVFTEPTAGYCVCVAPGDLIVPRISVDTLNAVNLRGEYLNIRDAFIVDADGVHYYGDDLITTTACNDLITNKLNTGRYIATEEESGKLPSGVLPPLVISETFVVATLNDAYSLSAQQGDVAVVPTGPDKGSYILAGENPVIDYNWVMLTTPSDIAQSLASPVAVTFNGDVQGSVSFQQGGSYTATLKVLGDTVQNVTANGATAINFTNGYYAALNVTGACTLSFSGIANDGKAYGVTLEITNGGTNVTWPASVTWLDNAPTLKAAGKSMVTLVTRDGGASWLGQ